MPVICVILCLGTSKEKELNRNATGRVMGGKALAVGHSGGLARGMQRQTSFPQALLIYPFRSGASVSDSYYKSPEFNSREGKEVLIELNLSGRNCLLFV